MTIQQSGKWWRGDGSQDFKDFLRQAWSADVSDARFPQCDGCGCLVYRLQVVAGQGARRSCVACGLAHGICGSDRAFPTGAQAPPKVACECGKNQFEVAVAFERAGRRIAVARRCLACGILDLACEWPAPADATETIMESA